MSQQRTDTQTSYDRVAADYVRHIFHELDGKPYDRAFLDRFAERLRGRGVVCDIGCGPGHVARYLADRGLDVIGIDLSPGMVAQATELNPAIPFRVGDMVRLDEADGAWAGIVVFYAIIHIPPHQLRDALREMSRVLMPGGLLALAFHLGQEESLRVEEMWDQPVALDFWFYSAAEMAGHLEHAGFVIEEVHEREPYAPDVEHQSRRAYLLARKL